MVALGLGSIDSGSHDTGRLVSMLRHSLLRVLHLMLDLRLRLLLLSLVVFVSLSLVLGTSIGSNFQICCSHVGPAAVDVADLHFGDK